MKKIMAMLLAVVMALGLGLMTACSEVTDQNDSTGSGNSTDNQSSGVEEVVVNGIEYLSGLEERYGKGASINLSDITIKVSYSNGKTENVKFNPKDFKVTFDFSEVSDKSPVTIEYKGFTCVKNVVVFQSGYEVTGVVMPEFYTAFLNNKVADDKYDERKPMFKDRTVKYVVGDDNGFKFRPTVQATDFESGQDYTDVADMTFTLEVEKFENDSYKKMDNFDADLVFDGATSTIDFSDTAVGNSYKLTVYPAKGLTPEDLEANPDFKKTIEVNVVDGYNVYDFAGFSLIDNRHAVFNGEAEKSYGVEWVNARKNAGITVDSDTINGIVLHNKISVDPTLFPKKFILNEQDVSDDLSLVGSLRDNCNIIKRNLKDGKKFNVYGNLFEVNGANIPLVKREGWSANPPKPGEAVKPVVSHATMLKFEYYLKDGEDASKLDSTYGAGEEAVVENISFTGNLKKKENTGDGADAGIIPETGGCILVKNVRVKSTYTNMIASQWYITNFSENTRTFNKMTLNKNKYFDNYNCFIYNWGGTVDIKDSTMIKCGGPVIIADQVNHYRSGDKSDLIYAEPSKTDVDDKTLLESFVTGTEGWFTEMGASGMAAPMIAVDSLFNVYGKSFIKTENGKKFFNFVILLKSGDMQGPTAEKIDGTATIGTHLLDMQPDPLSMLMYNPSILGLNPTFFQTKTSIAFPNIDMNNPQNSRFVEMSLGAQGAVQQPIQPGSNHELFGDSKYLNAYVGSDGGTGYMGIIFGNYHSI